MWAIHRKYLINIYMSFLSCELISKEWPLLNWVSDEIEIASKDFCWSWRKCLHHRNGQKLLPHHTPSRLDLLFCSLPRLKKVMEKISMLVKLKWASWSVAIILELAQKIEEISDSANKSSHLWWMSEVMYIFIFSLLSY